MTANAAYLADRGVIAVAGAEAASFLQVMITNDVIGLASVEARFAALLSPQGKIFVDFLVVRGAEEFLVDCPAALAGELTKKLTLHRLRAKVAIVDRSAELGVAAYWNGEAPAGAYRDPRVEALGWRRIAPRSSIEALGEGDYAAHRIACGVPQGGVDFPYGDTFPHDANMDLIHGLDFGKGCYIGQEVVSRMQHRGVARKRVVPVHFSGPSPAEGAEILSGTVAIGAMGASRNGRGLALLRVDKAAEAEEITCEGRPLGVELDGFLA